MKPLAKSGAGEVDSISLAKTNLKADESGKTPRRLIAVLRKKRSTWRIPRINEQQLLQQERDEFEHLKELFKGTTPTGRELYRKILCGIRHRVMRPDTGVLDVVAYALSELRTFPSLEPEFKLLYQMDHSESRDPGSISLVEMATHLSIVEQVRLVVLEGFRKVPRSQEA